MIAEKHCIRMILCRGLLKMSDNFWSKVASLWSRPVDQLEKAQQQKFLDNLPNNFGKIDDRLISDDLDDDIDDF